MGFILPFLIKAGWKEREKRGFCPSFCRAYCCLNGMFGCRGAKAVGEKRKALEQERSLHVCRDFFGIWTKDFMLQGMVLRYRRNSFPA